MHTLILARKKSRQVKEMLYPHSLDTPSMGWQRGGGWHPDRVLYLLFTCSMNAFTIRSFLSFNGIYTQPLGSSSSTSSTSTRSWKWAPALMDILKIINKRRKLHAQSTKVLKPEKIAFYISMCITSQGGIIMYWCSSSYSLKTDLWKSIAGYINR